MQNAELGASFLALFFVHIKINSYFCSAVLRIADILLVKVFR